MISEVKFYCLHGKTLVVSSPFCVTTPDRSVDLVEVYTDEDEDYSSPDEGSDSEPILEDGGTRRPLHHLRGATRSKSLPPNARVSF